jgi:SAM-dependent methyltransferase
MQEPPHYLRLYTGDEFDDGVDPLAPHVLSTRELLRPPVCRESPRHLEPFTRAWYEELELKRYLRQGAWLSRWLEFSRHPGESLLVFGPGLGTDAIQYDRHGTKVTIAVTPEDADERLSDRLHLRGIDLPLMHVKDATTLPVARGFFDLVYWNALHTRADLHATVEELFRVMKPGGKLFALFPAKFDVDRWQRWLLPFRQLYRHREPRPTTGPKRTGRELTVALSQFTERRISKRLLRRSELPHVWRWLPLGAMERIMGRVLAVRAFKPVTAARQDLAAAA